MSKERYKVFDIENKDGCYTFTIYNLFFKNLKGWKTQQLEGAKIALS